MPWINKALKKFLIPGLLLLLTGFQWIDDDFTQHIAAKLLDYRRVFSQEKAYLHLDKPYYTTGDTLWFKSYLVEGSLHLADSASNLLYVDLIEQRTGRNVALRRVQLSGGIGHGEIVLADSIPKGAYTIRAYTNWMRNFSENYFFQKDIYLFDPENIAEPAAPTTVDLKFFPEGGQLIAGVNTRVALKQWAETASDKTLMALFSTKTRIRLPFTKATISEWGVFSSSQNREKFTMHL